LQHAAQRQVAERLGHERLLRGQRGRDADPTRDSDSPRAVPPDPDGLAQLAHRLGDADVVAVIETMNGARFVHDQLELAGWDVRIADAQRARAPLACKTDRIDAQVLAELARRDLVPEVWLPDPRVRGERERARFRLHLVKHRTMLKNRINQTLVAHGLGRPTRHLFTPEGRVLFERLPLPEPWHGTLCASFVLIESLDEQISELERELRTLGADHPYVPLLMSAPGIAWILAYTIAAEIGDINRFPTPRKLIGYTGLCPRVYQSGESDRRGALAKNGPNYLRWALIEAAHTAGRTSHYRPIVARMRDRHGRRRGSAIASVEIARRLSEAIWWMLTRNQPLAPASAA
jgi:transposase